MDGGRVRCVRRRQELLGNWHARSSHAAGEGRSDVQRGYAVGKAAGTGSPGNNLTRLKPPPAPRFVVETLGGSALVRLRFVSDISASAFVRIPVISQGIGCRPRGSR